MKAPLICHETYKKQLKQFAEQMDIPLDDGQIGLLIDYLSLLLKWNKAYNLTAIREADEMLTRHLLDSLAVAPFISADRILDVGTGPGLPGIPLAIVYPDKHWTLLDSNGKKTRFLTQCKIELGLSNIDIVNDRVEKLNSGVKFAEIVSRAFASLQDMTHWCQHLLEDSGRFLAMKGQAPAEEIQQLEAKFKVEKSIELKVPGCVGERHLIIITTQT